MWQQEGDVTRPIKEKSNINALQTASVGHPKYLLLFFSVFIPLTSWTLNLYQKKKQNQMEFIYQPVFNLLCYQASGSGYEYAGNMYLHLL